MVTDNGSQFTAKEFKDLIRRFVFKHIRIRWYHPESNGLVERSIGRRGRRWGRRACGT